ncbi:MAG: hypothetical protein ABIH41_00630, partial [Nanoarchaeota archaeon]
MRMAIKTIRSERRIRHMIDDPVFAGYGWTPAHAGYRKATAYQYYRKLFVEDAVALGSSEDTVLQSGREAAAFYVASLGTPEEGEARLPQVLRTPCVTMKIDGKWYSAFDDNPDPRENIILTCQHRYRSDDHNFDKYGFERPLLRPMDDPLVRLVLDRAENGLARVVEAPQE